MRKLKLHDIYASGKKALFDLMDMEFCANGCKLLKVMQNLPMTHSHHRLRSLFKASLILSHFCTYLPSWCYDQGMNKYWNNKYPIQVNLDMTQWDQENRSVVRKIRCIHMTNPWYASDWDQAYRPSYAKIRRTVVRHIQVHLYLQTEICQPSQLRHSTFFLWVFR